MPPRRNGKKKTLAAALTGGPPGLSLLSNVPPDCHANWKRLAAVLGLRSTDEVKELLVHPRFRLIFNDLWVNSILPRKHGNRFLQGPQLNVVRERIQEEDAEKRYDGLPDTDRSEWDDIDYYAFVLYVLRRYYWKTKEGLFYGKYLSVEAVDERVWQLLLRAQQEWRDGLKRGVDPVKVNPIQRVKSATRRPILPAQPAQNSSSMAQAGNQAFSNPLVIGSSSSSSAKELPGDFVPVNNRRDASRSPPGSPNSKRQSLGKTPIIAEDSENDDLPDHSFERLKLTMNPTNPNDITTSWGKYVVIKAALDRDNWAHHRVLHANRDNDDDNEMATNEELLDQAALNLAWEQEVSNADSKVNILTLDDTAIDASNKLASFEVLNDNQAYQPIDYLRACIELGFNPASPRFNDMPTGKYLKSWQVTAIHRITQSRNNRDKAIAVCDGTGLGKTLTSIGSIHVAVEENLDELASQAQIQSTDALNPTNAKPIVVFTLPNLLTQWREEFNRYFPNFYTVYTYHSDARAGGANNRKITGTLKKNHIVFKPNSTKTMRTIILTTIATLSARHGSAQKIKELKAYYPGKSSREYDAMVKNPPVDFVFQCDLSGAFDIGVIDEAHVIKSKESVFNRFYHSLGIGFTMLLTASLIPNRITDLTGYIPFFAIDKTKDGNDIWAPENMRKHGINRATNPFTTSNAQQLTDFQLTTHAMNKFIVGGVDDATAAIGLKVVWERFMIRRIYQSRNPQIPDQVIGKDLPRLNSRVWEVRFSKEELETYSDVTRYAKKNLCTKIGNTVTWNRRHSTTLILASTWTYLVSIQSKIRATTMKKWKTTENMLHQWLRLIHTATKNNESYASFDMPSATDTNGILKLLCEGAPKIRAFLRIVSELIVRNKKKVIIWTILPSNQLLLHGIFQLLAIPCSTYTAELSNKARDEMVESFNSAESMAFIGSYFVGSTGLNLQYNCHHTIMFDSPPSKGLGAQANDRNRRMGQPYAVEAITINPVNSFQNMIVQKAITKAIPGAIAECSLDILANANDDNADGLGSESMEEGQLAVKFGQGVNWWFINGELIENPSDEARRNGKKLVDPIDFIEKLLNLQDGTKIKMPDYIQWVAEDFVEGEDGDGQLQESADVAQSRSQQSRSQQSRSEQSRSEQSRSQQSQPQQSRTLHPNNNPFRDTSDNDDDHDASLYDATPPR